MRIVSVVGARPQFVKAAVVSRALATAGLEEILVHTGQHYDFAMSEVFFQELRLPPPRYDLGIGSGPQGGQTGRMLEALETVLLQERPDYVLVYGDTNSTLAGALAAAKLHIPVVHVEAGMRSNNRAMPEEINRIVTDHLASLNLCVNQPARQNLAREGIHAGVEVVGDVMYDAALLFGPLAARRTGGLLAEHGLQPGGFALLTCHRQENTDHREHMEGILKGVAAVARRVPVVFPVHPRTKSALAGYGLDLPPGIFFRAPVSYLDSLALLQTAALVLTDSGGVQREAFFYRIPCLTLRQETEWQETVASGANVLVGSDPAAIAAAAEKALRADKLPDLAGRYFGDGQAARHIAEILSSFKADEGEELRSLSL